ncbi:disease resistance protein RGA5-like isoform X1 [Triticum urartu]|uniref:disease resistance protein RGA5-like isoform X1 n=1 Tax=Triticum urartu TaxID=4572 RepID=UPI0020448B35|nr:disease resistance protein RGA5-like isoform X1 [Triticum urartu]XP_048553974.1 disease resistance protein RGA5-like isoform X1 [Triticum urartu]XP_048553975.1 disease resistance protein RGA5-like isoform X1 [Triticum urartu]XP_048553976.1 disease resistance protein RGA5-like isoform X1 [Triticum urartu]XP_048553977.1 disease resistance protein RGA5-like isoform X1 [Triticum urartu]
MELPLVSASLGAMGYLAGKLELDPLLDVELKLEVWKLTSRLVLHSEARESPVEATIWMKDVRELSYDMENCIDLAEPDWVARMSGFKARVKEANEQYDRCMLGSIPICSNAATDFQIPIVDGRRRPDLPVVGLHDGLFDALYQWLTDDDKELKVASIVGVGGIGKTTLAKQLWHKHKPGGYFGCRAFVRTAKKPDIRRFLRSMLAQVRPHQPPDTNEVHELIHDIRQHLQGKSRYFLIIDDLWATSVWDVARRAFPEGNGSRIITTTEIKDVALACCRYQSKSIYKMEPLSVNHSEELFIRGVFASGEEKSRQLDKVWEEIIRRCAGLPLAIISISSVLASQGEANTIHHMEQIQNILPTNTTHVEVLKQVLNFCYNCLPSHLQTCLLYLSFYPENYIILKEDIVKQWVAESFILAPRQEDKMKVAGNYFHKLLNMGLIQHIEVGYSNEVYYYAVHPMVHNLITSKSREENFMTVIDYSQRTMGFSNKVSHLSLQFGSATHATRPEIIGLSQVRSLAFIGLKSCYSSILEFKVLRVLILHIWADEPSNTDVDLNPTSELVLLRSLQVTCNDTIHLPDLMQGPKHLDTLEINARVAAIPARIVHLRSWLHLRLGVGTEVPDLTGTLKIVTSLNPPISLDDTSCPHDSVMTMELLSPICRIPKWIEQLANLCILKLVLGELQSDHISIVQRLPSLTVLSLHVQRRTTEPIGFGTGAFSALEYFEFRCGVLCLRFQKGTMPNLQRLKLGFNAHRGEEYGGSLVGVEGLSNVKEISGMIGSAAGAVERDLKAAESAFKKAMGRHLNVSIERADMVEELDVLAEKQHEIPEEPKQESQDARGQAQKQHPTQGQPMSKSSEQTGILKQVYHYMRGLASRSFIKRSGPAELRIKGKDDLHILYQLLVSNKETGLEKLTLERCPPLELKHLLRLTNLKTLIVKHSDGLVGSQGGGQGDVEWKLPVEYIKINDLHGNTGEELTELLPHLPKLSKLEIFECENIKKLVVGVDVQPTTQETSEMGGGEITAAAAAAEEEDDGVLLFPAHLCDSLRELVFYDCPELVLVDPPTLVPGEGGFQALRSLQRLTILRAPKLLSTFSFSRHLFPSSLQFLSLVGVEGMETLEPLSNLSSLTRLELIRCGKDLKCQGLWSLLTTGGQLNKLRVTGSHRFFADWDPNPRRALEDAEGGEEWQTQLVSSTLRELWTDDIAGLLAAPVCTFLSSSLTKLQLWGDLCEGMELFSKEQEDALQLLSSLQELEFWSFKDVQQLPAGLRNLTSLKILSVKYCPAISSLPNDGLPDSLEKLYVRHCSEELDEKCRGLVGTIPDIIII